jgi:putative peptide zinc metalloprotease protein
MTLQLRPTFSESWYRVQHLKPKLRGGAQISRQFYRGERWYVVRDPAGNQYHRLSDAAYAFVGLLDGHRTIGEAWELVGGQLADDAPTQPEVIQILTQLYAANLIETNISLDATVLLRRYKKQQMQKTKGRLMNILFPRIPIWDPDWWLKMWMPLARVVLSPAGMVVWLIVVGWAMFALLPHWDKLKATGWETINFSANPINALWLGAAFIVLKLIHEAGHGFFCRRFGGEVHELGVMFLVLMPAPYVDASSAWSFPNKWHRILVGAGGMVFEIFVAALAAFVWINTMQTADPMGQWIHQMAYNIMLIASVSTVVFNANPLLRYDGYYMLSDYLEIPNLQHRSREYSLYLIKRHLFRVKWSQPLPPVNHRPWLLLYNYTSGPYRIFVGLAIMLMVLYQLPEQLKILGMILFLGSIITFFGIPLYKSLKYLLIEPELHRKRTLAWSYTLGFIGLIGLLVGYFNFPFFDVRGEAVLLPLAENRAPVFPRVSGRVEQVVAKDGQPIKKGDTILVMANEQLVAEYDQLVAQMDRIKVQMAQDPRRRAVRPRRRDGRQTAAGRSDQAIGNRRPADERPDHRLADRRHTGRAQPHRSDRHLPRTHRRTQRVAAGSAGPAADRADLRHRSARRLRDHQPERRAASDRSHRSRRQAKIPRPRPARQQPRRESEARVDQGSAHARRVHQPDPQRQHEPKRRRQPKRRPQRPVGPEARRAAVRNAGRDRQHRNPVPPGPEGVRPRHLRRTPHALVVRGTLCATDDPDDENAMSSLVVGRGSMKPPRRSTHDPPPTTHEPHVHLRSQRNLHRV